MKKNIIITIQARMGSTRFPGKTLSQLGGYPMLEYMVNRLRRSKRTDDLVLATTTKPMDDPIVTLAGKIQLKHHRGSEEDVLGRVHEAAQKAQADIIVLTTGDDPLLDAGLIDEAVDLYANSNYDCVGVGMKPCYPYGLDFYVIGMDVLTLSAQEANLPFQREHVIEYVTSQPERFRNFYMDAPPELNRPDVKVTVDFEEHLETLNKMQEIFGKDNFDYSIKDIIDAWDLLRGAKTQGHRDTGINGKIN